MDRYLDLQAISAQIVKLRHLLPGVCLPLQYPAQYDVGYLNGFFGRTAESRHGAGYQCPGSEDYDEWERNLVAHRLVVEHRDREEEDHYLHIGPNRRILSDNHML